MSVILSIMLMLIAAINVSTIWLLTHSGAYQLTSTHAKIITPDWLIIYINITICSKRYL